MHTQVAGRLPKRGDILKKKHILYELKRIKHRLGLTGPLTARARLLKKKQNQLLKELKTYSHKEAL